MIYFLYGNIVVQVLDVVTTYCHPPLFRLQGHCCILGRIVLLRGFSMGFL